jgi:hypothetical protein
MRYETHMKILKPPLGSAANDHDEGLHDRKTSMGNPKSPPSIRGSTPKVLALARLGKAFAWRTLHYTTIGFSQPSVGC